MTVTTTTATAAGATAPGAAPQGAPGADAIRAAVADAAGIDPAEIAGDDNLIFLGLGSLEMMRLATRWRRQGIPAEFGELAAVPTVDAWAAHLQAAWDRARGGQPEAGG